MEPPHTPTPYTRPERGKRSPYGRSAEMAEPGSYPRPRCSLNIICPSAPIDQIPSGYKCCVLCHEMYSSSLGDFQSRPTSLLATSHCFLADAPSDEYSPSPAWIPGRERCWKAPRTDCGDPAPAPFTWSSLGDLGQYHPQ